VHVRVVMRSQYEHIDFPLGEFLVMYSCVVYGHSWWMVRHIKACGHSWNPFKI
jgi:hypothetical protein